MGNFITKTQDFSFAPNKHCEVAHGQWMDKPLTVIKTPDIFSLSVQTVRDEMKNCVSLCPPGPNVLLLLVKPSDFTEENRETLKFILNLFDRDAFKHSLIISTQSHQWEETNVSVDKLLQECDGRQYKMFSDDLKLLMAEIEKIVSKNRMFLSFRREVTLKRSALNLVLFGRRGPVKTSAAKAILGQTDLPSASSSSECVRNQGEVHGRLVSVVELPALCGKAQHGVMEESFRCISLCDPEGVHAFILVLPVGPLTDEDKGELKTIQDTFGSRVNDFTMILFTTESGPTDPNCIETDRNIQELLQSCGGRYDVLNIKVPQQIPGLLERVEESISKRETLLSYTIKTLACGQIEDKAQFQAKLMDPKTDLAGKKMFFFFHLQKKVL
uniref:AIG1-type G domain-containing protein n=1 Tax=Cyprinodon variegatus TaxID=28743 RepID=A0A3Q2DL60_CYPVA